MRTCSVLARLRIRRDDFGIYQGYRRYADIVAGRASNAQDAHFRYLDFASRSRDDLTPRQQSACMACGIDQAAPIPAQPGQHAARTHGPRIGLPTEPSRPVYRRRPASRRRPNHAIKGSESEAEGIARRAGRCLRTIGRARHRRRRRQDRFRRTADRPAVELRHGHAEGRAARDRRFQRDASDDRRQARHVPARLAGRPGRPAHRHDRRAAADRRQRPRDHRTLQLGHEHSRVRPVRSRGAAADLDGHVAAIHGARLQDDLPAADERRAGGPHRRHVRGEDAALQAHRDHRRPHGLRPGHRRRIREGRRSGGRHDHQARLHERQGARFLRDPDQPQGDEPGRDLLRRRRRAIVADDPQDAPARDEVGVRDGRDVAFADVPEGRRRRGRRRDRLHGRAAEGEDAGLRRLRGTLQGALQRRRDHLLAVLVRRHDRATHRDEGRELDRPEGVHAVSRQGVGQGVSAPASRTTRRAT